MADKENGRCSECGSKNAVRKGRSKTKFSVKQIYKCKDCGKRFVSDLRNKSYPIKIIMNSIVTYNLGNNLAETSKIIKKRFKVKVPEKTVYSWVKEFDKICSYYRTRDKAVKLFTPEDVIFIKIFRHLQLYKYRHHKAKIKFFANAYFNGLKDYLINISKKCPNELFNNSIRSSRINLDVDFNKVKVFEKKNYACKLASLALQAAGKNSERHDKLQEFMLCNDTCTIATEVPIYLFLEEVKEYGIINLFDSSLKNDTINNKIQKTIKKIIIKNKNQSKNKIKIIKNNNLSSVITGHIDFVQLKFGSVYVLDYKPEASKVNAISQLFVYALALSLRTGIWLRNFRCAWFDENGYYEFAPSDIVLKFCRIPKHTVRELFVRNKARRYFTSDGFQQNRLVSEFYAPVKQRIGMLSASRDVRYEVMEIEDFQDPRKQSFRETGNSEGISKFTENLRFSRVPYTGVRVRTMGQWFQNNLGQWFQNNLGQGFQNGKGQIGLLWGRRGGLGRF